ASAWIIRFPGWKLILLWGGAEILFAFFLFTHHQATISFFIGFLMTGSGFGCLKIAFRARHIQRGTSVFELMRPSPVSFKKKGIALPVTDTAQLPSLHATAEQGAILTVHIWTPEGSANQRPVPRPIINRYIAAVDSEGVISTGHASLELRPHLYISLYPKEDIDRSPSE
ncbi:MFS transporter, partial [Salmonella enterica subsp. enterica]|nr:MFS transporter [Salmonella enterica subsp. enterica serovar Abony]